MSEFWGSAYNPNQRGDYLYLNGRGETPVFKNDKIIIPKEFKIKKLIDDNFFIVTKGDQTGIISKEGHWLLPLFKGQIDDDNLRDYGFLLAEVISGKSSKNKKFFLINSEGKRKSHQLYDAIDFEDNGSVIYRKGKRTGYLKKADESIED